MRRRWGWSVISALTVIPYLFCADAPVSGPSTEEGNPQIVAVVVDTLRQPVAAVPVTAYRLSPIADSLEIPSPATEMAYGLTDEYGRCTFDSLPPGIYSIEAKDLVSNRRAIKSRIQIDASNSGKTSTDTLVLSSPAAFCGIVSRGGWQSNQNLQNAAIMVIIQEIALSAITPTDGSYFFSGLPADTYTVIYYATDGFVSARKTVVLIPGDTLPVDTVFLKPSRLLPPKGFSALYDTSAALVHLSWRKVVYDSLRWYEVLRIDLEGPYDDTLRTVDTSIVDSVNLIPSGITLNYIIRSVDRAFNTSDNAGPIEVTIH